MSEPFVGYRRSTDWRIWFGLIITGAWLMLGAAYIYDSIGWTNIGRLPADELGSFLEGAFAPLAFLWLVIGYFLQQKELEQNTEALRAQADMENLRRRHEKELENARKFALDRFVEALLPVLDSMELGLNAASEEGADVDKLREGGELTLKLFNDVMGKFNVEVVDPLDQPFNPEHHQAMSMQPREDVPPNTVVTVVQKGYLLNGRLVRPAMVMVSRKPS